MVVGSLGSQYGDSDGDCCSASTAGLALLGSHNAQYVLLSDSPAAF